MKDIEWAPSWPTSRPSAPQFTLFSDVLRMGPVESGQIGDQASFLTSLPGVLPSRSRPSAIGSKGFTGPPGGTTPILPLLDAIDPASLLRRL